MGGGGKHRSPEAVARAHIARHRTGLAHWRKRLKALQPTPPMARQAPRLAGPFAGSPGARR